MTMRLHLTSPKRFDPFRILAHADELGVSKALGRTIMLSEDATSCEYNIDERPPQGILPLARQGEDAL